MDRADSLLDATLAHQDRRRELLQRYLRNQLQEAQREALEVRFMEDAALLADVEEEQLLLEGMKAWAAGELAGDTNPAFSMASPVARRRLLPAIAATFTLALLPVAWWLGVQHVRSGAEVAAFYTLAAQRGSEQGVPSAQVLEVAPETRRIVLRLPAPNRPGPQELELWRRGEDEPLERLRVQPDADGWVVADFSRPALRSGSYVLRWPRAGGAEIAFELREK